MPGNKSSIDSWSTVRGVSVEPWVDVPDEVALADWDHEQSVVYNQVNRQTEKYRFYVRAFDFLNDNRIVGDYHEFGCHRGRTFRMALTEARRQQMADMRFYAFDSFEGLPPTSSAPSQRAWCQPGALATSEEDFLALIRRHGIYVDQVSTVPGYFDSSLTPNVRARFAEEENKIALVCVDCDLHESAVPVFDFIEPLLQEGSIIYIDDLFAGYRGSPAKGVARAFLDFQGRSSWRFVRHLDVGWWGRSYIAYRGDAPNGVL